MRRRVRTHAYRLNSLVIALVGVGAAVYALSLPIGTLAQPGSGLWPLVVSVVLTLSAIALLVAERDPEDYEPMVVRTFIALAGFALLALFILGFQLMGLTIPSLLLVFVWMRWLARESWTVSALVAVISTVVFVVVFVVLLGVPMPKDPVLSLLIGGRF